MIENWQNNPQAVLDEVFGTVGPNTGALLRFMDARAVFIASVLVHGPEDARTQCEKQRLDEMQKEFLCFFNRRAVSTDKG